MNFNLAESSEGLTKRLTFLSALLMIISCEQRICSQQKSLCNFLNNIIKASDWTFCTVILVEVRVQNY